MSYDESQFDWQIVRGERFNCKRPERLKAAILKAEENVTEAKLMENPGRFLQQSIDLLNHLKSKQTPNP